MEAVTRSANTLKSLPLYILARQGLSLFESPKPESPLEIFSSLAFKTRTPSSFKPSQKVK